MFMIGRFNCAQIQCNLLRIYEYETDVCVYGLFYIILYVCMYCMCLYIHVCTLCFVLSYIIHVCCMVCT